MKKIFVLGFLMLFFVKNGSAQDKGFTLLLGPAVNVFYGNTDGRFVYTPERLGWQLNGQFGFISTRGGTNRGNMLAVFGNAGSSKPEVIYGMQLGGAEITGTIDVTKNFNEFYTLEGGMVIGRFLRLSGGFGRQYYTYVGGIRGVLNYYSGTAGIAINLGMVNWVIDANLMAGKDLNQNTLRFGTGFMVKF
jgi:hypothetical protein